MNKRLINICTTCAKRMKINGITAYPRRCPITGLPCFAIRSEFAFIKLPNRITRGSPYINPDFIKFMEKSLAEQEKNDVDWKKEIARWELKRKIKS